VLKYWIPVEMEGKGELLEKYPLHKHELAVFKDLRRRQDATKLERKRSIPSGPSTPTNRNSQMRKGAKSEVDKNGISTLGGRKRRKEPHRGRSPASSIYSEEIISDGRKVLRASEIMERSQSVGESNNVKLLDEPRGRTNHRRHVSTTKNRARTREVEKKDGWEEGREESLTPRGFMKTIERILEETATLDIPVLKPSRAAPKMSIVEEDESRTGSAGIDPMPKLLIDFDSNPSIGVSVSHEEAPERGVEDLLWDFKEEEPASPKEAIEETVGREFEAGTSNFGRKAESTVEDCFSNVVSHCWTGGSTVKRGLSGKFSQLALY
jgi:hypothetical protein